MTTEKIAVILCQGKEISFHDDCGKLFYIHTHTHTHDFI